MQQRDAQRGTTYERVVCARLAGSTNHAVRCVMGVNRGYDVGVAGVALFQGLKHILIDQSSVMMSPMDEWRSRVLQASCCLHQE